MSKAIVKQLVKEIKSEMTDGAIEENSQNIDMAIELGSVFYDEDYSIEQSISIIMDSLEIAIPNTFSAQALHNIAMIVIIKESK